MFCNFKLQRVFKMSHICMDPGTKSQTPLVYCIVNNSLHKTVPNVNQTPLQIFNISHLCLINTILHSTPNLVVNRVEVRTVGRPKVGSNQNRYLSFQQCDRFTSITCSVCWGAVLLESEKKSPEISCITGSIS